MYDSKPHTLEHIQNVRNNISRIIKELLDRAENHDLIKFGPEEKPIFDEHTLKLKDLTYGSKEYNKSLSTMKIALDHHYANSRHHPEHFENGISGMNLIDLTELIADWYAATKRHSDGDIHRSIDINQKRFGYSDDLKSIMHNTADWLIQQDR
jgi:hypothetical protein